jgi:hypothetical protein
MIPWAWSKCPAIFWKMKSCKTSLVSRELSFKVSFYFLAVIRPVLGIRDILMRIRNSGYVKSWIRICIKVKFRSLEARIETWRALYAHSEGLEAQNRSLEGLNTSGCRFRIRIEVKSWIRTVSELK